MCIIKTKRLKRVLLNKPRNENMMKCHDEVLIALDEETQITVNLINAALTRITDGRYGICSICQGDIPKERLAALPM